MSGAGAAAALEAAALAALGDVQGISAYAGPPVQAAAPYATIEAGPESDWSHKSGAGREVRLAVTLWDRGERPARLRTLAGEIEAATLSIAAVEGWQLVSLYFLRSRTAPPKAGAPSGLWATVIEFRARLLRN